MHRHMLAEDVPVADSNACRLTVILQVLRCSTNNTPGKETVIGSDGGHAGKIHVWLQYTPCADCHVCINHRMRTHLNVRM